MVHQEEQEINQRDEHIELRALISIKHCEVPRETITRYQSEYAVQKKGLPQYIREAFS